jgi:hypothetical protein
MAGQMAWEKENMPGGRTGVDCVVLPNGRVILANGAATGRMNGGIDGGSQSKNPVFEAWQ